jgi:hypothetical protein
MKITQKKLEANRDNALKGGPKTPEGKRKVSQNARTHGLAAKEFALSEEEKPEFEALQHGLQEDLQPNGAVLWLLFEEVVACAWQVRAARRCVQAEVRRMLEATKDETQGLPAKGTSRAAMILAGHPYTLTPFQVRGRKELLKNLVAAVAGAPHRLGDWKEEITAAFGADFWQTLETWQPLDPGLLYDVVLTKDIKPKIEMYDLESICVEKKDPAIEEAMDRAVKTVRAQERREMFIKLTEVKQQALQEALQYAVGVETGEVGANGKNRLELFLRYQTTAKRDFFRALEEYEKRKKVAPKV